MGAATDIIHINHEQDNMLLDLWDTYNSSAQNWDQYHWVIPADLIISKTLPLHNFDIVLDERGQVDDGAVLYMRYRIVDERLNGIPEMIHLPEGNVTFNHIMNVKLSNDTMPGYISARVGFMEELDYLAIYGITVSVNSLTRELTREEASERKLDLLMGCALQTWYGIEIAMLHPVVKEIFVHPVINKERLSKQERKVNNQKIYKYIKHHYVQTDELNDAIYGTEAHSYNRKALIWYVSGHWRKYKTGKRVFIQPYWKGALRATKRAEPRNREILINKEENT